MKIIAIIGLAVITILSFNSISLAITAEELLNDVKEIQKEIAESPDIPKVKPVKKPNLSFDGGKEADKRAFEAFDRSRRVNDRQRILDEIK